MRKEWERNSKDTPHNVSRSCWYTQTILIITILTLLILTSCTPGYTHTTHTTITYPGINMTIASEEIAYYTDTWNRNYTIISTYQNQTKHTTIYHNTPPTHTLYEFTHHNKILYLIHYQNGTIITNIPSYNFSTQTYTNTNRGE